jgi:hypothetical protein
MKHGCVVMTLRLSSGRRSGSRQIHRSRKKRVKFAAMSSPCWSFFSTSKALSTRNPYPWSNCQWKVLLWGFETVEGGHSAQTSRQVEEQQLVSTPWQRSRSHITRCSTVPDFQKYYSDSPPPYLLDLAPCDFFLFRKTKLRLKGRRFEKTEEIHAESHTHIWELPGMHEIMGNTLGSLYTGPRGLLRRGRWKLGVTVRNFLLVKFPEFLGSTSCIAHFFLEWEMFQTKVV